MNQFLKYLYIHSIDIEAGEYEDAKARVFEKDLKIRMFFSFAITALASFHSFAYGASAALSFLAVFYGGSVFIYPTYKGLRERRLVSFLPVSLAILTLYIFAVFTKNSEGYFNLASSLISFSLLGYWIEVKSRVKFRKFLNELSDGKLVVGLNEKNFLNKLSALTVFFSLFFGLAIFLFWYFGIGIFITLALSFGISAMFAVLQRSLKFSFFLPSLLGAGLFLNKGILIKDRSIFSKVSKIDVIVFIKTRILTTGQFKVSDTVALAGFDKTGLLREQASLEVISSHPISQAIVEEAKKQRLGLIPPQHAQAIHGEGVQGMINGRNVVVGSFSFMAQHGIDITEAKRYADKFLSEGKNISFVAVNGQLAGVTAVYDELRMSSAMAVNKLKSLGFDIHLITGDSIENASAVGKQLGIDHFLGSASIGKKVDYVKKMQQDGKKVAIIGEEVADAAVLSQADISVKITDKNIAPADEKEAVLKQFDPMGIFSFFKISKMVSRKTSQNLYLTIICGVFLSMLAMGVFYIPFGIYIPVDLASFLVFFISFAVILNSSRIGREAL